MWNNTPADIIGEVLAYFDHPAPALFGISVATRGASIAHFARRRPTPDWFAVNIRAALLCHPAAILAEVMILRRSPIRVSRWSMNCKSWQFWFDEMPRGFFISGYAKPIEGVHPSIALIAQASKYVSLDYYRYRSNRCNGDIYESGDGIIALYALYIRAIESCHWELAMALEQHCDIDAAVKRIGYTQYAKWICRQVTHARHDNVHVIARLRRYRGKSTTHNTLLSDRKLFDIAVKYGCWQIARHLIESPSRLLPSADPAARGCIRRIAAEGPAPSNPRFRSKGGSTGRAVINTNKMIDNVIDGKIRCRRY